MISGSALRSSTSWDIDSIILAGGEEKERWTSQKIETYQQYMAELKIFFPAMLGDSLEGQIYSIYHNFGS